MLTTRWVVINEEVLRRIDKNCFFLQRLTKKERGILEYILMHERFVNMAVQRNELGKNEVGGILHIIYFIIIQKYNFHNFFMRQILYVQGK